MTKDEALRLALEALETSMYPQQKQLQAITAIQAALEAKDEPVKLRRGDILRCIETDELCTVWATSTSGKTLVKWKGNDFGSYTAEQIGELFWLEPKEKDESWTPDDMAYRPNALPQRTWVGLTEDEIVLISADCAATHQHTDIHFARAIEAKLKEKNG